MRGQFQPVLGQRRIILKDLLGGDARRQCGRDVVNRNARAADDRGAAHDVIGDGDHLARGVQPFQPCDGTLEEGQKVDGQEVVANGPVGFQHGLGGCAVPAPQPWLGGADGEQAFLRGQPFGALEIEGDQGAGGP